MLRRRMRFEETFWRGDIPPSLPTFRYTGLVPKRFSFER
jgi:hypothetical protein